MLTIDKMQTNNQLQIASLSGVFKTSTSYCRFRNYSHSSTSFEPILNRYFHWCGSECLSFTFRHLRRRPRRRPRRRTPSWTDSKLFSPKTSLGCRYVTFAQTARNPLKTPLNLIVREHNVFYKSSLFTTSSIHTVLINQHCLNFNQSTLLSFFWSLKVSKTLKLENPEANNISHVRRPSRTSARTRGLEVLTEFAWLRARLPQRRGWNGSEESSGFSSAWPFPHTLWHCVGRTVRLESSDPREQNICVGCKDSSRWWVKKICLEVWYNIFNWRAGY